MNKLFLGMVASLFSILLMGCFLQNSSMTSEYMVLIGEDASIVDKIGNIEVLVIDADYFNAEEIRKLKENNIHEIYTYLNVGAIEKNRSYYAEYQKGTLGEYENWPDEKWMDVSQTEWQDFMESKAKEFLKKGIDGFFIDNLDVYYIYENDEIYEGIIRILSMIKATNKKVIINGGDYFVKKYLKSGNKIPLFDGVNQEDVWTSYDFQMNCCIENSGESKAYYTEYLDALVQKGYQVYVLEYATDYQMSKKAYAYAKEHNYICYVSNNIELTYLRRSNHKHLLFMA